MGTDLRGSPFEPPPWSLTLRRETHDSGDAAGGRTARAELPPPPRRAHVTRSRQSASAGLGLERRARRRAVLRGRPVPLGARTLGRQDVLTRGLRQLLDELLLHVFGANPGLLVASEPTTHTHTHEDARSSGTKSTPTDECGTRDASEHAVTTRNIFVGPCTFCASCLPPPR